MEHQQPQRLRHRLATTQYYIATVAAEQVSSIRYSDCCLVLSCADGRGAERQQVSRHAESGDINHCWHSRDNQVFQRRLEKLASYEQQQDARLCAEING
jgi:hypothetical protein